MRQNKFINILITLFLLACVEFYSPQFLPIKIEEQTAKGLIYSCYVLLVFFLIPSKHKEKNSFDICFKLIMASMPFSMVMASTQHSPQSFPVSIIATMPYIVPYSAFFLFKRSNITLEDFEKIILILGIINVLLTLQLYALVPNQLFGGVREGDDGRGMRIGMVGDIFKIFLLFYSIYKYKEARKKIWLVSIILCFLTVLLSLTRQVIAISSVLAILYFMKDVSLIKKLTVIAMFAIATWYVFHLPYFEGLIEVTERQTERESKGGEENIRIVATKYYINDAQENFLTRVFGNGCFSYGNSEYGEEARRAQYLTLCFPSDVSFASFYYLFGIMGALGISLIFIKTYRMKIPPEYEYLKYVIYYIMLASIASGPLLYMSQIIVLTSTCYLLGKINYYGKVNRSINIK